MAGYNPATEHKPQSWPCSATEIVLELAAFAVVIGILLALAK